MFTHSYTKYKSLIIYKDISFIMKDVFSESIMFGGD